MNGFSQNDAKVLLALIEDGFASDTKVAKSVGLTVQAVGKIRKRLSQRGFVLGSDLNLNLAKLGVGVIAVSFVKVAPEAMKGQPSPVIKEILNAPSSLCVLSLSSQSEGNLFVKSAFRNLRDCEHFFSKLEKEYGKTLEIKKLQVCSTESLLKDSKRDLLKQLLEESIK